MHEKIDNIMKMMKVKPPKIEDVEKSVGEEVPTAVVEETNPAQNFEKSFDKISTLLGNNIGFSVAGGLFDIHLKRNSALPCKNVKSYTTAFDYQRELVLPLFTGERPLTRYCGSLGKVNKRPLPIQLELNPTYVSKDVDMIVDAMRHKKQDTELVKLIKELKTMIRDIRVRYDDFEVREAMNSFLDRLTKMENLDKESVEALI
jgi:molecular chaperone DnaK (HSP70)